MKKVLSMALALMMVLTLFAVPAMAVTMTVENIPLGDMTSFADGTDLTGTNNETQFGGSSAAANNALSKIVAQNGNNVMQLASTGANAELRSTKFTTVTGREYVASADVYLSRKYGTDSESVDYGYLQFQMAGATSAGNLTWGTATATAAGLEDITATSSTATMTFTKLPLNTWLHITAPVTLNKEDLTTSSFNVIIKTDGNDTSAVYGYVDNVSLTHEEEAVAVTKTVTGNGTMTGVEDLAGVGETKTLTLTPTSTSYLKALTVNGTDVTANATKTWDATLNNYVSTYEVTLNADTAITAEFADYTMVTKVDEDMEGYAVAEGFAATNWGQSTTSVVELTTDPTYGNVLKVTAGEARTPAHTVELGIYKVSFDAKVDTAGTMKLQNSAATSASVSKWQGKAQGAYRPEITTSWAHYEFYFEPTGYSTGDAASTRSLSMGIETATGLYLDNVNIVYYSTAAAPAPEVFDVTITGENAVTRLGAATSEGEEVIFIAKPKFGYYIESITIGGTPFNGFDAYEGGTYSTGAIEADTEIVVTTAELSANTEDGVSTDVATLPAVFAEAGEAPVTFGKVLADVATVDEFGIYLTKGGEGVTSAKTEMGPHFKAFYNVNGQYAIEFQGLEAGEYVAQTYVKVAGEITYGIETTFTVE